MAATLVVLYFVGIAAMAPGRPFGDDIPIAADAAALDDLSGVGAKWSRLTAQHNEHRPATVRLVFYIVEPLPPALGLTVLALTGGLALVVLLAVLAAEAQRAAAPAATLVLLASLLFNFGSAESGLWAMAAVSNFGVLAAVALMLALLRIGGKHTWLALVPALAAVGLQGNGVMVPALGAGYLLCNGRRAGVAWAGIAASIVIWYFRGYVPTDTGVGVHDAAGSFGDLVLYALAFLGSAAGFKSEHLGPWAQAVLVATAALTGAVLVGITVAAVARGALARRGIAVWLNLFLFATAALAALTRVDYGIGQSLVSRYHVNSCTLAAATTVLLLEEPRAWPSVSARLRTHMPAMACIGIGYVVVTIPALVLLHDIYVTWGEA